MPYKVYFVEFEHPTGTDFRARLENSINTATILEGDHAFVQFVPAPDGVCVVVETRAPRDRAAE